MNNMFFSKAKKSQDIRIISYEITSDKLDINKIPVELERLIIKLHDMVHDDPHQAIKELTPLITKYPDIPMLYNYLIMAYQACKDEEKIRELVISSYEKNPEYLFAKCSYANLCMVENNIDKVAQIFDNKFDLKVLYPDRDLFHISEAITFSITMGKYFLHKDRLETVQIYIAMLKKLDANHPELERLELFLMSKQLKLSFATFFPKKKKKVVEL